jgi:hypothetical protein
MAKRHAKEKPKGTHSLVQCRPGNPVRHQMDLKGSHILQTQMIRRTAKITAKLCYSMNVGSLCRRRQIADRHVFNHAAA